MSVEQNLHVEGQFLLNPDGSVPGGVDLQILINNNIKLVIPQEPPRQWGYRAQELPAQLGADGRYYQQWHLVVHEEPSADVPQDVTQMLIDTLQSMPADTRAALLAALQN